MARTRGAHSQTTAPRVRDAALRLFARHGYAAVSMRQIATEVGVQAGALYNYTPDKQSLLVSLLKGHLDDLLTALDALNLSGAPTEQLRAFTNFHIEFHLARPDAVFISNMELRNLEPANFEIIEALRGRYDHAVETILDAGRKAGEFDVPDTRIATFAVIAMLNGVNLWYRQGGRLSLDDVQRIYWDMVRKSVSARA